LIDGAHVPDPGEGHQRGEPGGQVGDREGRLATGDVSVHLHVPRLVWHEGDADRHRLTLPFARAIVRAMEPVRGQASPFESRLAELLRRVAAGTVSPAAGVE